MKIVRHTGRYNFIRALHFLKKVNLRKHGGYLKPRESAGQRRNEEEDLGERLSFLNGAKKKRLKTLTYPGKSHHINTNVKRRLQETNLQRAFQTLPLFVVACWFGQLEDESQS